MQSKQLERCIEALEDMKNAALLMLESAERMETSILEPAHKGALSYSRVIGSIKDVYPDFARALDRAERVKTTSKTMKVLAANVDDYSLMSPMIAWVEKEIKKVVGSKIKLSIFHPLDQKKFLRGEIL